MVLLRKMHHDHSWSQLITVLFHPHFTRLRLCLADFAFSLGLPSPLALTPVKYSLIIKDYQSAIALLTYYCNTSLECWFAVVHHSATSGKWQVTGTPDPETDHFSKLYGLLFFFLKTANKGKESSTGLLP